MLFCLGGLSKCKITISPLGRRLVRCPLVSGPHSPHPLFGKTALGGLVYPSTGRRDWLRCKVCCLDAACGGIVSVILAP